MTTLPNLLGHTSSAVMSLLFSHLGDSDNSKKNSYVCDVYFRVKRTRNQFSILRIKQKFCLNLCIVVLYGGLIDYHLSVGHAIFLPFLMMLVEKFGYIC